MVAAMAVGSGFELVDAVQQFKKGPILADHGPGSRIEGARASIEVGEIQREVLLLKRAGPRRAQFECLAQFGSEVLQALKIGREGIDEGLVRRARNEAFAQGKELQRQRGRFHGRQAVVCCRVSCQKSATKARKIPYPAQFRSKVGVSRTKPTAGETFPQFSPSVTGVFDKLFTISCGLLTSATLLSIEVAHFKPQGLPKAPRTCRGTHEITTRNSLLDVTNVSRTPRIQPTRPKHLKNDG